MSYLYHNIAAHKGNSPGEKKKKGLVLPNKPPTKLLSLCKNQLNLEYRSGISATRETKTKSIIDENSEQSPSYRVTLLIVRIIRPSCCPPRSISIPTATTASSTTPPTPLTPWRIWIRRWGDGPIVVSGELGPLQDH